MGAVRRHGPGVSVAEIAAAAGITKPVLYRHFTDRADLQRAVGQRGRRDADGADRARAARPTASREQVIRAIVDAFLGGIEDEPELWRFVVHHPVERTPGAEIVDDARAEIARMLTAVLERAAGGPGRDTGGAAVWAQGLVGMVQSAGDWWLERRTMSRAALTDYLTAIIWGGLSDVLEEEHV